MEFFKVALEADFLLFLLGIYWLDISGYIQQLVAKCNPKLFGFVFAILFYIPFKYFCT